MTLRTLLTLTLALGLTACGGSTPESVTTTPMPTTVATLSAASAMPGDAPALIRANGDRLRSSPYRETLVGWLRAFVARGDVVPNGEQAMGVLVDHVTELRAAWYPGGELVLAAEGAFPPGRVEQELEAAGFQATPRGTTSIYLSAEFGFFKVDGVWIGASTSRLDAALTLAEARGVGTTRSGGIWDLANTEAFSNADAAYVGDLAAMRQAGVRQAGSLPDEVNMMSVTLDVQSGAQITSKMMTASAADAEAVAGQMGSYIERLGNNPMAMMFGAGAILQRAQVTATGNDVDVAISATHEEFSGLLDTAGPLVQGMIANGGLGGM